MAEVHLDHPGEVSWFAGHGPAPILGKCEHRCEHRDTRTVAWGHDFDHYELAVCVEPTGCNKQCRGWLSQYPGNWGIKARGFQRFDAARETSSNVLI